MTHAVDGWSLALDFPAADRAGLWALAAEMDRIVLDAGGRFYFAKDLTLAPGQVPVKPAMAAAAPTPEELLTPPPIARPERVTEILRRSEEREEDRFDLPPPG